MILFVRNAAGRRPFIGPVGSEVTLRKPSERLGSLVWTAGHAATVNYLLGNSLANIETTLFPQQSGNIPINKSTGMRLVFLMK